MTTNIQPPELGPTFPVYPGLDQVVRINPGTTALAGNIYAAFLQQYKDPLTLRDRVPVYVVEPNGITLGPGYYDCRLVSSYLGLPLFSTTCCVSGSSSSSRSSK